MSENNSIRVKKELVDVTALQIGHNVDKPPIKTIINYYK